MVTPDGIEQLTESEFESIFPLISQIEENEQSISIHRFEGELRKFYDVSVSSILVPWCP